MSLFPIPAGVEKKLERLQREFSGVILRVRGGSYTWWGGIRFVGLLRWVV